MTMLGRVVVTALLGLALTGCTSGSTGPSCSFADPAQMPPPPGGAGSGSAWPKFRANLQNTGTVTNVTVSDSPSIQAMFPPADELPRRAFIASPVLNNGEQFIYIGSADTIMYRLSAATLAQDTGFNLVSPLAFTSTAVAAIRDGQDAVFVGGTNGYLYGVDQTGNPLASFWPFVTNASISASPALATVDGTVYVGGVGGLFSAVCPNGLTRFGTSTPGIQSSVAISPDGTTVFVGADDRQLRALQNFGSLKWAFAASGPIVTAPVVEVQGSETFVYVADRGGRVFKVNGTTGQPVPGFSFAPPVLPISSSPALAAGRLYFGSDDGNLYAISTADGSVQWSVHTDGQIVSSPAVAVATDQTGMMKVTVVVGSKDGNLYFVDDADPQTPLVVPLKPGNTADEPIEPIESSPAIGSDGTVYVGTDGGRVYALR
jgi:outer membrane protein assembly factor BamB